MNLLQTHLMTKQLLKELGTSMLAGELYECPVLVPKF